MFSVPDTNINLFGNFYQILQRWETHPSFDLYFINFEIPFGVSDVYYNSLGESFNFFTKIDRARKLFNSYDIMNRAGFLLARDLNIPGENVSVSYGKTVNGLLPTIYVEERGKQLHNSLGINVLETNISVADMVIRPWVQLYSRYGAFSDNPIFTTMYVYMLSKGNKEGPKIRKVYKFFNCIPITISDEVAASVGFDVNIKQRESSWRFSNYSVEVP